MPLRQVSSSARRLSWASFTSQPEITAHSPVLVVWVACAFAKRWTVAATLRLTRIFHRLADQRLARGQGRFHP
jgi:hypothetical protein